MAQIIPHPLLIPTTGYLSSINPLSLNFSTEPVEVVSFVEGFCLFVMKFFLIFETVSITTVYLDTFNQQISILFDWDINITAIDVTEIRLNCGNQIVMLSENVTFASQSHWLNISYSSDFANSVESLFLNWHPLSLDVAIGALKTTTPVLYISGNFPIQLLCLISLNYCQFDLIQISLQI